jgi:2-amino-4-hydroxy-6-hydroxymethyldihydropteridine diphosphokinase
MSKDQQVAYLSLGSNLGDRAANLLRAVSALVAGGLGLAGISSLYETDPVDFPDQPSFLNLAIAVTAEDLEPFTLLKFCLETESRLGRRRTIPRGARTIDIDLLLLDDLIVDDTRDGVGLELPHPRMHLRRFVLAPMAEIAPHLKHPVFGETIGQLLEALNDPSAVRIYRG